MGAELTNSTLEDRLRELEVRVAFIDDMLMSLNAGVAEHDRLVHELHRELKHLRDELGGVKNSLMHDPYSEPPPPHY